MLETTLDRHFWDAVPYHFWSVVFFVLGSIVGSFLNVCIHRLPLGQSVVSPPSHCPHCKYSIQWYLNIPLITWLYLRGKCRNCGAPISSRYFLVELLTGLLFLATWLAYGRLSVGITLAYMVLISGLIAATFIDFEHYIIPDEITLGGIGAGFAFSFLIPRLHDVSSPSAALVQSLLGIGLGAGVIYSILRVGKLLLGRHKLTLSPGTRVIFTEEAVLLPQQRVCYEEVFYRDSDAIRIEASQLELVDRCYKNVLVELTPNQLRIEEEKLNPEEIPHMEVVCDSITLPREAMGLGDVKFMASIGAFLGWKAVLFILMASSFLGSVFGITAIVLKRGGSRLPYGPYIAAAAVIWIFGGKRLVEWWFTNRL
jgi:leader peptidase (prepilin peptidase)/N-methyltransferase